MSAVCRRTGSVLDPRVNTYPMRTHCMEASPARLTLATLVSCWEKSVESTKNRAHSTPEVPEDWAEKKDIAKDFRYENHRSFIEKYSSCKQGSLRWKCTQANFTVGVRGLIKTEDFNNRLTGLGIQGKKIRDEIITRMVRKTFEILDAITTFFLAVNTNPEWAKHAVSKVLANTSTERYNLFKKFTGPTSGFDI